MTAQLTGAAAGRADEARGAVPQDEGAALSTVENGEAGALPSVGGLLRGVALAVGQVRPVGREATRVAPTNTLLNPPGDPKASYWAGGAPGPDPAAWRDTAERRTGSWWEAWATWVLERSGAEVQAPARVGSDRHPPLEPAPGANVLDRVP